MPGAARSGDITTHGGTILGPGVMNVLIEGRPAAVIFDLHSCPLPPVSHQPTVSPFPSGSTTVMIGGRPAVRVGDMCICGASPVIGSLTVLIG